MQNSSGVKIGICGLHNHPSDPFLFLGFFQRSLFPCLRILVFIILVSTINLAVTENPEFLLVKLCAPIVNQEKSVRCLSTVYHYASLPATSSTFGNIPSKELRKKCPC